ncbi:MAG: DUF3987 domain-containing protein, partial [Desulfobacula sp.]
ERIAKDKAKHADAAKKAVTIYDNAMGNPAQHPYAIKKGLPLGDLVRRGSWAQKGWNDALIIPIYSANGSLASLQAINVDGAKDFLAGGKIKGCFDPIGKIIGETGLMVIGEGLATVAAVCEVMGCPGVAAFSAGNLEDVAREIKKLAPLADIVLIADDDQKPGGHNPGEESAMYAAHAVGGKMAIPDLGKQAHAWDVRHELGADGIKAMMVAAVKVRSTCGHLSKKPQDKKPEPLPDELLPVEPFNFALLPDSLRPWAQDICERIQCPPDFVGVGIMVSLATVLGRKIGIRPQARTDWTVTPNLWGLVVGRPGVLKSPALDATLAPLNRLVLKANAEYDEAYTQYKAELALSKMQAEANEKQAKKRLASDVNADVLSLLAGDEPETPILCRYKTNDSTPASLGELLRQNANGLLVYRDELVSLLKGLDREDQAEGRGFYLTGWNGDSPYTFDRIGRGLNLHIDAVCLSILGGTQPGRLAEYIRHAVKGGAADDGLIQRFGLMVWPDTGGTWKDVDRYPDTTAKNEAFKVFDYLDKLNLNAIGAQQDNDIDGNPEGQPYLRFDPGGLELFLEWRIDLETRLRSNELHPALESHFAKYRKLIPALALIIHLADGGTGPVTEKATLQALAWGDYLETHARRAYGAVSQPEVATAKAIIAKIKKGDLPASFTSNNVTRPGWAKLSDREQVADALRLLVDYGWLWEERTVTGGRPSIIYHTIEGGQE